MSALLLSIHVLAAIIAIGPITIAASMFPRFARAALASPDDPKDVAATRLLWRITRAYTVVAAFVPVFGLATAFSLGVISDPWLIASMVLTAVAAVLLIAFIVPDQDLVMNAIDGEATDQTNDPSRIAGRLGMLTGMFNLAWAIVVILMIYRPGSTTGVGV